MIENIKNIKKDITEYGKQIIDSESLESFRLKYLSRKGLINDLFENF